MGLEFESAFELELRGRDWPLERLEREIGELAAHIHAGMSRWLALLQEFDRREGWADWGCKSCAHWLSWQCAVAPSAAREHVRVARRLAELPLIRTAFGRGELSYSKVRALSRVATPDVEASLLEIARYATADQLERTLRAYCGVLDRELSADERAHGDAYLVCEHDEDGSLLLRGRLPAEDGALVLAALDAARDTLHAGGDSSADTPNGYRSASAEAQGEPPAASSEPVGPGSEGAAPSNASALVLMAETLLASGPADRSPAESYQVVVHLDAADLTGQLDDGPLLHPDVAQRLACDASVVRIIERDGRPLSVGRRTRSVPPALRRALKSRDTCCRFPGCTQRRFLHAHHIHHWARGGPTDLDNLVHLCRFHHRLVHEGGYTLGRVGRGGELRFRAPDGRSLPAVPDTPSGREGELERRSRRRGLEIGPATCASGWMGDRLDLAAAVDAIVWNDPRLVGDAERA